ncbi:hypothetical protein AciM339_0516 [Aciduliprofundum sp. MAR08-339]|uniref:DUF2139 domain-containing protein n=1 Tax=Aciduliprofundum sp. (strain MAR08-339) TaxID=673860 RepID=UPI0002A4B2A6|nr:hypothetical protein AciM339_0516 [Aciduliprofundum sp. MAR08-339]
MTVAKIVSHLHSYPPRYGPGRGSGGIFGLKYHRKMLYYTLSFDAEAHFVKDYDEQIYNFQMVGKAPTSGGDTYNAVETVDEYLYFGGWVHAPANFQNGGIDFKNKYSHVHEYNIDDDYLKLIWKDSIHNSEKWAGEVSDIIYDPHNDRLLIARGDGHENLGVYAIDRSSGEAERLTNTPVLKGDIMHDEVFFGSADNYKTGLLKILKLDLQENKWEDYNVKNVKAIDGEGLIIPSLGDVSSLYNRIFAFTRGGVLIGNPANGEGFKYARLLDFFTFRAPLRSNALYMNGGILIAYNAQHDSIYRAKNVEDRIKYTFTNTIVAPTLLLYISLPMVKIVGAFGARITSMENLGDKILIGTNTAPNLGIKDALPYDSGHRGFSMLSHDSLQRDPPSVSISIPMAIPSLAKKKTKHSVFGGIPLDGYRDPRMIIYASKSNELTVYEYDLALPLSEAHEDKFNLTAGKNLIALSSFSGIVSFKLRREDYQGKIRIELK